MYRSRRFVVAGMAAGLLSACVGGGGGSRGQGVVARAAPDPAFRPVANPGYDAWVEGFRARATAKGISPATLNAAFRGAGFLPGVVERDRNQTEFKRTTEDYLAIAASDERLALGRAAIAQHGGTLAAVESRFGVSRHVVAAVWGLESRFGTRMGDIPIVSAL